MIKRIKQHYNSLKLLKTKYRINTRQSYIEIISKSLFGVIATRKLGISSYILIDKLTDEKFYFTNLSYVIEQLQNVYEQHKEFELCTNEYIVDVGAACGEYTIHALKQCCQVIAIEPDLERYGFLLNNINSFPNIVTYNEMIGTGPGTKTSDEIKTFDEIDILKIDVEGAELKLLENAPKTLKKTKKIIIELHSVTLFNNCSAFLKNNGFNLVHTIGDENEKRPVQYWRKSDAR